MIQMQSILDVADNSGARKIAVINPMGGATGRYAKLGDIVTCEAGLDDARRCLAPAERGCEKSVCSEAAHRVRSSV